MPTMSELAHTASVATDSGGRGVRAAVASGFNETDPLPMLELRDDWPDLVNPFGHTLVRMVSAGPFGVVPTRTLAPSSAYSTMEETGCVATSSRAACAQQPDPFGKVVIGMGEM
jgi:hypothetical protein